MQPQKGDVFTSGQDGHAVFRIPSVVVSGRGTILAFAEGRRDGAGDAGRIDTVLRRSTDGGRTWGALQVVQGDGSNTWGNPSAVLDTSTGKVWLLSTWNRGDDPESRIMDGTSTDTRRVFVTSSDDDGLTWAPAREITSAVKPSHWRWYATGPGHAIQLRDGRLLVPANHSDHSTSASHPYRSHVIVSDDHGATWRVGGVAGERTNESTAAELDDGRVCLNMRSYHQKNRRAVAYSTDRGETWGETILDLKLIEPVCQASLLRHATPTGPALFIFSNPASTKREKLTIRVSRDACATWSDGRLLHAGKCGYSDLCTLSANEVGCLYERDHGGKSYAVITFARIPLEWLMHADKDRNAASVNP